MLLFGGFSLAQLGFQSDTWLWNYDRQTWSNVTQNTVPYGRSSAVSGTFLNQSSGYDVVVLFGGITGQMRSQ